MPPPCRSAGAARAPRNRSPQSRGPPTAAPRLHPAGAPHQPADGRLSELRLGPTAARLLSDADIAALFRRMFDLPPNSVPIVLNVDGSGTDSERPSTSSGHGPAEDDGHQAMMRQAISFAVRAVLIAAGRTPDPYLGGAYQGGQVFLTPAPGPRLYMRDHLNGRLESIALLATAPTQVDDYVNREATVRQSPTRGRPPGRRSGARARR